MTAHDVATRPALPSTHPGAVAGSSRSTGPGSAPVLGARTLSHDEYLGQRRFATLDGLRGISILLVFTAHPAYQTFWHVFHGAAGVTIFFVLSGFLITTLLLREHAKHGRVDLTAFYTRRLFRIYPLFLLVFAFYCVLILGLGLQSARREGFVENIPYFLLFLPEHSHILHTGPPVPFDGSWSIGIEEKFYLVWPVLGFVVLAAARRARLVVLVALAVVFTAFGWFGGWAAFVAPYAHLAYGALAAVLLHHGRSYAVLRVLGRPPVLGAVAAAAALVQFGIGRNSPGGVLYTPYGILVAALLCGIVVTRSRAVRWLGSRPMVYIGALSYSLYLVHNFGINAAEGLIPSTWGIPGTLLSTALGLAAAFLVCHVLHRWFEEPLRLFGARLARERRARRVPVAALPGRAGATT